MEKEIERKLVDIDYINKDDKIRVIELWKIEKEIDDYVEYLHSIGKSPGKDMKEAFNKYKGEKF